MKIRKIIIKSSLLIVLITIMILVIFSCVNANKIITTGYINKYQKKLSFDNSYSVNNNTILSYNEYKINTNKPDKKISLSYNDHFPKKGAIIDSHNGSIFQGDNTAVVFNFDVEEAGAYAIEITYTPLVGNETQVDTLVPEERKQFISKSGEIERSIKINNKTPFKEAEHIKLTRFFKDAGPITTDELGDEIRSKQVEVSKKETTFLRDFTCGHPRPYMFNLDKGLNQTLEIIGIREPMIIHNISFKKSCLPESYSDAKKMWLSNGYEIYDGKDEIVFEGEKMTLKSSPVLIPQADTTSSKITPYYNGRDVKLNVMGVYSWRLPGYWVEYEINAPKKGLYAFSLYAKQSLKQGTFSTREITINSKVPFAEASYIPFVDNAYFSTFLVGTRKEPYLFPLEKGKNIIRIKSSLATISDLLLTVQDSIEKLNKLYLEVKMVVSDYDEFKTYEIKKQVPLFEKRIQNIINNLELLVAHYHLLVNNSRSRTSSILTVIRQLKTFIEYPNRIVSELESLESNITSMGSWLIQEKEQPLTVDKFFFHSPKHQVKRVRTNVFENIHFEFTKFFKSFSVKQKKTNSKPLNVWVLAGRDQAQILKRLVDNPGNEKIKKLNIVIDIVNSQALLKALTSGRGPDVALMVPESVPIDLAFRKALCNLAEFSDFNTIADKFNDSALVPFKYQNGIYALPETQTFPVFFYRKDIFDQLGLTVNKEYMKRSELEHIIGVLQNKKLNFFIESPLGSSGQANIQAGSNIVQTGLFSSILYQMGGSFYNEDLTKSALLNSNSKKAFREYTDFFSNKGIPKQANFINRFRSGEMPAGIISYDVYNSLSVFAPEISGKWEIANVPTFVRDENISNPKKDYQITSNSKEASIILNSSKQKDVAWEFLKWWLSDDIQLEYGRELEVIVGAAARYATANKNVAQLLPWPGQDIKIIEQARKRTRGIPQLPGGYMTTRQFNYAFLAAVDGEDPLATLYKYMKEIDVELEKKRNEFQITK